MTHRLKVLGAKDRDAWLDVLKAAYRYDFYHTPSYHDLAERRGEGEAVLLAYSDREYTIALPLLLRPLAEVPGLQGSPWKDATSVYGYAGPVASHPDVPAAVREAFRQELSGYLSNRGVVSVFSKLHPLLPQGHILAGIGETIPVGSTVSIDLTLSSEEQRCQFRDNHRRDIRKLYRDGATFVWDRQGKYLARFVDVYLEHMLRLGASNEYFFDHDYFESLLETKDFDAHLFLCFVEDQLASGGLFTHCDGIVQYHLGATHEAFIGRAPSKLLFDRVREWADKRRYRVMHLGGGVGASEDSLFRFKAGFSKRRHQFALWYWTVRPEEYEELTRQKRAWNKEHGFETTISDFYPLYRAPVAPRD